MQFTAGIKDDGKMLREYLRNDCKVTRNTLVKLKKSPNGIKVNGEWVTVRKILKSGDIIELDLEDKEEDENEKIIPTGEIPEIAYEDETVMVVNKPSNMPTHTSFGHYEDSLANTVCAYYKKLGKPFVFRAVNRLDRDTSGAVIIAKNAYYCAKMGEELKKGNFNKIYIAILDGKIEDKGKIEGYIAREGESIIKRVFSEKETEGSDYSLTYYEKISENNGKTLVKVHPVTGRTHQIRVHFSSLGAAICGDTLYGKEDKYIKRQALHAISIEFDSASDKGKIKAIAKIPSDIKELADKYGLKIPSEEICSEWEYK